MSETTNFIFSQIAPQLWAVIVSNIFLSMSVLLSVIASVIGLYKSLKQ